MVLRMRKYSLGDLHRLARIHLERAYGTGLRRHIVHSAEFFGDRLLVRVRVYLRRDESEHTVELWLNRYGELITLVERD